MNERIWQIVMSLVASLYFLDLGYEQDSILCYFIACAFAFVAGVQCEALACETLVVGV